jgi:hypothetical protein
MSMFANVSPTCSPCGHVMQPIGPRTLWERKIGGAPASFWFGQEYECVSCLTRVVLVDGSSRPSLPGSVGHDAVAASVEPLQTVPAERVIWAEHLPAGVRRDSTRKGGTMPLSQRQQATGIVEDFWSIEGADPMLALDALARLLGVDLPVVQLAKAIDAAMPDDPSLHTLDGPLPEAIRKADGSLVDDPAAWPAEGVR